MGWRLARVAAVSALVVAVLYIAVVGVIDAALVQNLQSQVDQRITSRLGFIQQDPVHRIGRPISRGEQNVPIYVWLVGGDGALIGSTVNAPQIPAHFRPGPPETVRLEGSRFRVTGAPVGPGWLVVGQGVDDIGAALAGLVVVEAILLLPLAAATFLGSLLIARRSVAPVEEARRRQLAFTADASHELRTPLTVIEAEASLALGRERDADSYRGSLERIAGEGARLRRIVEDLLWLARFDAEPGPPGATTVDVGAVAASTVARFQPLAAQRSLTLAGGVGAGPPPLIAAPAEWIDRLVGVLVDNACRYSRTGGGVAVEVGVAEGRVRLTIDDSGPGIPAQERLHIFDRFHRATETPGGAGLGLAIGDAVVRATGGRWEVGDSPAGGARMAVTWPLVKGSKDADGIPSPLLGEG
ncbi:MAG: hypothetical protein NVS9B1_01210 [Candidatus Dormibacteraceae bacterium]